MIFVEHETWITICMPSVTFQIPEQFLYLINYLLLSWVETLLLSFPKIIRNMQIALFFMFYNKDVGYIFQKCYM